MNIVSGYGNIFFILFMYCMLLYKYNDVICWCKKINNVRYVIF